ncbi:FHA domain-containing protein [Nocardioides ferulae]|uniref:FHA domain-containing protein n=1 Tax=Nocardioides ferulae TaxID=2340821 RepID=UPI000EAF63CC|nr:FHA domain-containing protein [Nocardioides ferulae]
MSEPSTWEREGAARSFQPGDWYAVLGPHVVVLLPPSQRQRAAATWSAVDAGAGFDEVLDAVLADGLRGLPAFALVGRRDPARSAVTALLRGPVRASFTADGETVAVDGDAAVTWVERTFATVQEMVLVAEPVAAGPQLPAGDGLVRVSRLQQPAAAAVPEPLPEPLPEALRVPEPEPEPAPQEASGLDLVEELLTEPVVVLPEPDDLPPVPPPAPGGAAVPPPPPFPPPAFDADQAGDHDGLTETGRGPAVEPSPATSRPVARLAFSHGETVDVDRPVVIGRAPEARRFEPHDQPRLVTVPSLHQEISATHVEVRPGAGADHGLAVATDLGSTNGTVVVQPGLGPEELRPGIPVQLLPGAVIDLGDGVTVHVTNP